MDHGELVEATYREYIGLFLNIGIRTYGFDLETAKDRLQETFIKVWTHRDNIRVLTAPGVRSYTLRALRSNCIDYLRKTKKEQPLFQSNVEERSDGSGAGDRMDRIADIGSDPLHEILLIEEMRLQKEALDQLPAKYRAVVELSLKGVKRKNIAQQLGIKESSIHNLKFRGLKKYEAIIKKLDPDRKI